MYIADPLVHNLTVCWKVVEKTVGKIEPPQFPAPANPNTGTRLNIISSASTFGQIVWRGVWWDFDAINGGVMSWRQWRRESLGISGSSCNWLGFSDLTSGQYYARVKSLTQFHAAIYSIQFFSCSLFLSYTEV